jgi:transposase
MLKLSDLYHERIDEIPVIVGVCQRLHLAELVHKHLGTHGLQDGLNNGQLCIGWLSYILSQGTHTKVGVEEWADHRCHGLGKLLQQPLRTGEFGDDRLGRLLHRLSQDWRWEALEAELWSATVIVHEISIEGIRLDSTTSYGHHQVCEDGMMQFGFSKDHRPDLPQLKLMAAAAEPSGHLIASDLYSGQRADDSLYTPLICRVRALLRRKGLLYTGDCKMSALETRSNLVQQGDFYLMPLALTGKQAETFNQWVTRAVEGKESATLLWEGKTLLGAGYEFERQQTFSQAASELCWGERVLLVRSLSWVKAQQTSLERQLDSAIRDLLALTPTPGRGKRQIRSLTALTQRIEEVLSHYGVSHLLDVTWEVYQTTHKHYQGRGRGSPSRPAITTVKTRYVITAVNRLFNAIADASYRLGWRVLLTNAPISKLSLPQAVCHYRGGWCLERDFHLLKDYPLGLSPLFVYKDDQIKGLTRLLTLALRLLTLIELQVRQAMKQDGTELAGLYEGQPQRMSKHPSSKRILKPFARAEITLTRVQIDQDSCWQVTPLPPLLQTLLRYLQLPDTLFTTLADNS